jgi:hypothetical protein
VGLQLRDRDAVVGQLVTEAVQPDSPEFRRKGAGRAVLAELGRVGALGTLDAPAEAFARPEEPRRVPRPLWPWFVALSGVVLLLDAAARRLDLGGDPRSVAVRLQDAPSAARGRWAAVTPARAASSATAGSRVPGDDDPPDAPPPPAVDVPADSYAGRLLAARKGARKKHDGR